jgi:hypothetical protein
MADWLDRIEEIDYHWESTPSPADDAEIAALAAFLGRPLPADYLDFLRRHDGGSLWYRDIWYLHLWRAGDIPTWSATYNFTRDRVPGALVIGSDGGSEALVLDARPERPDGQYSVYAINFISLDWADAIPVAPEFRSLLVLQHEMLDS